MMNMSDELTILVSVILESIAGGCMLIIIMQGEVNVLVYVSAFVFFLAAAHGISQLVYRYVLS